MQNKKYPAVESYIIKVSIPMSNPFVTGGVRTLYEGEKFFTMERQSESNHDRKVEFDRARALMKWAYTCNGELHGVRQYDGEMFVFVEFVNKSSMKEFIKYLVLNVEGATMK